MKKKGTLEKASKWFYKHDGETNGLPSAHVSYTLLVTYYLFQVYPDQWWIWIVAAFISVSTLFVKQHYIVDFVVSPLFVLVSISVTPYVLKMLGI